MMNRRQILLCSLFALLMTNGANAQSADRVHLKHGKRVEGKIAKRHRLYIEIVVDGKRRKISRKLIDRITDDKNHIRWEDAYTYETAHYRIQSNADRQRAEAMAKRLELFNAWFFKNFRKVWKLHKVKRMGVKMFRTRDEFAAYHRALNRKGNSPGGFYFTGDETLYIPIEERRSRVDFAKNALFHEGGHQILHLAANLAGGKHGRPRHWINEGIPCYFEALSVVKGKLILGVNGNRFMRALLMAEQGKLHPLEKFDQLTREQYHVDEYCQGYALAHFFMEAKQGAYREAFLEYARDVFFTRDRPDSFKKRMGKPIGEFEAEFMAWMKSMSEQARKDLAGPR